MAETGIRIDRDDDQLLVAAVLHAEIGGAEAADFTALLRHVEPRFERGGELTVVLDMARVKSFSAGARGALSCLADRLRLTGGRLILHSVPPGLVHTVVDGDGAIRIVADEAAALDAARSPLAQPASSAGGHAPPQEPPPPTLTADDIAAIRAGGLTLTDVIRDMRDLAGRRP